MMSTATHWSGPVLVVGALLFGLATVAAALRPTMQAKLSQEVATLLVLAAVFLVPSLHGLYAAQADAAGAIGLAGYALLQAGLLLLVVISAAPLLYPTATGPFANHPLTGALGVALFLGPSWRTPRSASLRRRASRGAARPYGCAAERVSLIVSTRSQARLPR